MSNNVGSEVRVLAFHQCFSGCMTELELGS